MPKIDDDLITSKYNELLRISQEKSARLEEELGRGDRVAYVPLATPLSTAKDIGVKLAQGVVDVGQAAVGIGSLATGGLVGQGMRAIGYDPEGTNQYLGQYLSPAQKAADEKVQQAQGFVDTLKASLQNPRAILGSVVESLPGMVAGMGVTGAVARGIAVKAAMTTSEGILAAETVAKAGGSAAKAAEAALRTKAGAEAAKAAIETAETKLLVTGAATEGAQSSGQIADQAQGAGRDYSDYALPAVAAGVGTGAINLLAGKLMGSAETDLAAGTHTLKGGTLAKIAKEGFSEGVMEEMPQSAQEQVFTNLALGKSWDEGVGAAAASGLLAGAAMGAGMGGLHNGPSTEKVKNPLLTPEQVAAKATAMTEAVKTGDTTALLDQTSKAYDPIAAVAVLAQMNKKPDTTQEDRTKNVESAYEVVKNLNQQRDDLVKQAQGKSKSEAKRLMAEAGRINDQMNSAQGVWDVMMDELLKEPAPQQVAATVQAANTPVQSTANDLGASVDNKVATDNVMQLATMSAKTISAKDAQDLAENMDNGLDDSQREYLRAFSDARVASNALKTGSKVSQEILYGRADKDMVGIAQYRERIGRAIAQGAQGAAQYQLDMLSRFADDHAAKASAAREALTKHGLGGQIQKTEDGRWVVPAKADFMDEGALRRNGGWEVRSAKGVLEFQKEAEALAKTRDEMKLAMGMRFGEAPVQSITAVPAVPASPSVAANNSTPTLSINTKENGKGEARLEDKPLQTVVTAPLSTKENQNNSGTETLVGHDLLTQNTDAKGVVNLPKIKAMVGQKVVTALNKGQTVTLHLDGQAVPITGYQNSLRDASGKSWGLMPLIQVNPGSNNRIEIGPLPNSPTRSASATPASSLADARSSQVAAPALETPTPGQTGQQAAAAGPAAVSAANPAPAREAAPAVGNGAKPQRNTGGSADGRLSASNQEVAALHEDMQQVVDEHGKKKFENTVPKVLTPEQQDHLKGALETVASRFGKEIGEVRYATMNHPTIRGSMVSSHNIVLMNEQLLDPKRKDALVHMLAHELAHRRDANNNWASDEAASLNVGGAAYEAAKASMSKSKQLHDAFNYIFKPDSKYKGEKVPREIFAQLNALYVTHPELFNDRQPLASTREAVNRYQTEGSGEEVQGRVAEGQSIPDGSGSGETRQAPASGEASGGIPGQPPVAYTGLKVLGQKLKNLPAKINEAFRTAGFNPVAQFLTQQTDSTRYKTARPLVKVENFMSTWASNPELVYGYIEEYIKGTDVPGENERHEKALNSLYGALTKWNAMFPKNFVRSEFKGKSEDQGIYRYADPMQYLLEEGKLDVEENVKTAMSAGMYNWILGQAMGPEFKDKGDILSLNGLDKEGFLHPDGEKALRSVMGFEDRVVAQIGQFVTDALGFKVDENAPQDLLPRLQNALGSHILLLMEKEGFIERVAFPQQIVQSWFKEDGAVEDQNQANEAGTDAPAKGAPATLLTYIRFNHGHDEAKAIKGDNFGTGSLVERLFGSEKAPRIAGTQPVEFTQKYAKGTQQEISDLQREAIEETMATPHTAIPEMLQLFKGMGRDAVLKVAGWTNVTPDLGSVHIHAVNEDSVKAQNQNLESQYDLAFDMLASFGETSQYYVEQSVWKNFRAGFSNQSLNQQTSKIHRVLFGRPDWTVTIDLKDQALVDEYRIALAMSLGVKTDTQQNVKTLVEFDKALAKNQDIMKAVDIIRKNMLGAKPIEWTPVESELVAKVASGGEGMMSLQALMSFAQFEQAKADKASEFKTTLLVGVDGKTNGPMLSHLALGAAGDIDQFYALLNRGGFYSTDNGQPEHFSEWYGQGGNQDLYENLGAEIIQDVTTKIVDEQTMAKLEADALAATKTFGKGSKESGAAWGKRNSHFTDAQLGALEMVTKQLLDRTSQQATKFMRKLTKVPLTSFAFGSALSKSVGNMTNAFIENHYANLQDIASGASQQNLAEYLKSINTLITMSDKYAPKINENLPIEAALKLALQPRQEAALRSSFKRVIGNSVQTQMESYFDTFINRRQDLNLVVQTGYEVFQAAYQTAKVAEMKRLMDAGQLAYTETAVGKKPVHDLTVKQERELRKKLAGMAPVMHSEYSIGQNDLGHGLYMGQSEAMTSESSLYKATTYTARETPKPVDGMGSGRVAGKWANRFSSKMQAWVEKSPGVIGGSYPIHSGDSAIMHKTLRKVKQTLNVHDEGSNSIKNVREMARALNQSTAETFLNYSPAREALHMIERSVTAMAEAIKNGTLDPSAAALMFKGWADNFNARKPEEHHISTEEAATLLPRIAAQNAFRADYMRLLAFTKLKFVDQYVWEGGQFEVTQAMRDLAQQRLDALSTELQQGTKDAMAYLAQVASENPAGEVDPYHWLNVRTAGMFEDKVADTLPAALTLTPGIQAMIKEAMPSQNGEQTNEVVAKAAREAAGILSPWGELGAPVNESNMRLAGAFEAKPVMNKREVLNALRKELGREPLQGVYGQLIGLIDRYLPDIEVHYVTKDTPVTEVLDSADKSRGWYVSKGGQQAVYLLSPEHKHSQLTVETVLHELLHAGLARTIESERNKAAASAAYTSEKLQLVQELESLHKKAADFAAKNKIAGFEEALKDVHEFASWGLTNKAFQDQVVSQISMQTNTAKTGLVQGMKDFIGKVAKLLFFNAPKNHQELATNGMALLVANVAGLYSQAAKADSRIAIVNRMATGQNLRDYTTHDIFNALTSNSTVSAPFEDKLRGLLDNIVGKLFGPMGSFREAAMKNSPQLPEDIFQHQVNGGGAPFAQKIMAAGFLMSDKEAFVAEQVEATLRAALESNEGQTAVPYKELERLYDEAARTVKPADLATGSSLAEQTHAKELHDFIFKVEQNADKKSDYLSRFAALGMANEQFAKALGFQTEIKSDTMAGMSLSQRLYAIFEKVLTWVSGKLTHTYGGQMADEKLDALVEQLVLIEAKKRNKINARQMKLLGTAEDVLKGVSEGGRKAIERMASAPFFKNSTNRFLAAGGAMVATVAGDRLGHMMDNLNTIRNSMVNKKRGLIMGLMDEARGAHAGNITAHVMMRATKKIEGDRKKIMTAVGNVARQSFDDKGGYLTEQHDKAITAAALRTDMQSLLGDDRFSLADIRAMLDNPARLQTAIRGLEAQLTQFGTFQHYYGVQAKGLGWKLATGEPKVENLLANAENIARAFETPMAGRVSETQVQAAEPIIDQLVSLYALQNTGRDKLSLLAEVMAREAARTDGGNGIEMVLKTHRRLLKESHERLFSDTPALRMKGYLPEIVNPHIEVVAASGAEAEMLEKIGYSKRDKALPRDPSDTGPERHLFVYRDGGLQSWLSGIVSTTGMNARGERMASSFEMNYREEVGRDTLLERTRARKIAATRDQFRANPNFDPSKVATHYTMPLLNPAGEAVNYRYMMTEQNRDALLERHNGFDRLLGLMAGNTFDKEKSAEQNTKAVQALKDQFDQEYHSKPAGYVVVGPDSNDAELREIWRLFPENMKQSIRDIWGNNNMRVRADLLDIHFGYRKLSLANAFDKEASRNLAEKMLVELTSYIYRENDTDEGREVGRRKAQLKVRIAENIWMELVKIAKENMVVKSLTTQLGNMKSNIIMLLWVGMHPAAILKHFRVAIKGALAYRKDNAELIQLTLARDSGYLGGRDLATINSKIMRLENSLARNPVKSLIDAGMMPTIAEDVSGDDDLYTYKSRYTRGLEEKLDKFGAKINPKVKTAYDWITMGKDTPLYKAMSYGVQLSDFVARYAMYQHYTTRQTNPLSQDLALNRVSEAFVNYDIPSQRKVQFANDVGLVYFTKYYIRIQKVLMQLYRENPGRAMMMLTAGHYFQSASELTNSSFIHHIGNNPLETGALKAVTTLDETAVLGTILSVFK